MNIVEPILFQASFQPEAPALCAQGNDVVSYARLRAQMNVIARRAMTSGLKRGDVVALSITNPLLDVAVILGLAQIGIVTTSVAGHKPPDGLKIDAVIANTDYPFAPHAKHLPLDFFWIVGDSTPVETAPFGSAASDKVCRIILTSGSTGDPKAVAMTHRLVAARNARFEYLLGNRLPALSRVFVNMGIAAALGFQFVVYILGRGGTLFFHGDNIDNTLRSFEVFRMQAMLATPTTLAQVINACERCPGFDYRFDTIFSGGALLPQALLERAWPRLCSHIITGYGSTETAVAATAPPHRIAHIPGAAGYVTPGTRIEIVDEADQPLPVGTDGIVRVGSEFAVDHYIDDPIESAQVFRNGWFYPGDLGSLTADNLLIISGRQNNVLNAGGGKMAAEKVEAALLAYNGVSEAAVFMTTSKIGTEEVWAGIVCREKINVEGLLAHCRSLMPWVFVPAHVVVLDALPVNAVGKVDRMRLKAMLTNAATA